MNEVYVDLKGQDEVSIEPDESLLYCYCASIHNTKGVCETPKLYVAGQASARLVFSW